MDLLPKIGTFLCLLAISFGEDAPANYASSYFDPHPIATYGAHPYHIKPQSAELSHPGSEEQSYGRRRGAASDNYQGSTEHGHDESRRYYRGQYEKPKYKYQPTHSHYSEEHHELDDIPAYKYNTPKKAPSYVPSSSLGDGYSPYRGYHGDSWMNTMRGGYDDFGYNYDRSNSRTPSYRPQTKVHSAYSAPSKKEFEGHHYEEHYDHDYHDQGRDHSPMTHYSFGAGSPDYTSSDDHSGHSPKSAHHSPYSSKGYRKPSSNGYGEDPYFTFGPKKPSRPSYTDDAYPSSKPYNSYNYPTKSVSKYPSSKAPSYYDDPRDKGKKEGFMHMIEEVMFGADDPEDEEERDLHDDADEPRPTRSRFTKPKHNNRRHNKRHNEMKKGSKNKKSSSANSHSKSASKSQAPTQASKSQHIKVQMHPRPPKPTRRSPLDLLRGLVRRNKPNRNVH